MVSQHAMRWAWLAVVLIVSNLATAYVVKKNSIPKVDPYRDMTQAIADLTRYDRTAIAIMGDSITRRARIPETICGYHAINIGIAGARSSNFISFAEDIQARGLRPRLIVVALGTNDTTPETFLSSLERIQKELPTENFVFVTTLQRTSINNAIRSLSDRDGAKLIEIAGIESADGLHPADDQQYKAWVSILEIGIRRALNCG